MQSPVNRTDFGGFVRPLMFGAGFVLAVLVASCSAKEPKEAWEDVPLPIAYEDPSAPGIMYFMNEADGTIQYGNRNPGEWMLAGPPSQERLERCNAGSYKCVTGWASLAPIIVGDMPEGVREEFPDLRIAVTRQRRSPCETFETTPLKGEPTWTQQVIRCEGAGVVQVERNDGGNVRTFNLKSAVGLFGTALLRRQVKSP